MSVYVVYRSGGGWSYGEENSPPLAVYRSEPCKFSIARLHLDQNHTATCWKDGTVRPRKPLRGDSIPWDEYVISRMTVIGSGR